MTNTQFFSARAAAHRMKFCFTLGRISFSIWSQIVVSIAVDECSCILNSTWTRATQNPIDRSNPGSPHKLPSDTPLCLRSVFLLAHCKPCCIGFHMKNLASVFLDAYTANKLFFQVPSSWSVQCSNLLNWWDHCTPSPSEIWNSD